MRKALRKRSRYKSEKGSAKFFPKGQHIIWGTQPVISRQMVSHSHASHKRQTYFFISISAPFDKNNQGTHGKIWKQSMDGITQVWNRTIIQAQAA